MSRDGSWSGACQRLGVTAAVVLGDGSPVDGRRHPSTSRWRVIPLLLGIRVALKSSSQIKNTEEVKRARRGGRGEGGDEQPAAVGGKVEI